MSEHRDKAVEAVAKARHDRVLYEHWADVGGERRGLLLEEARLDLQAAEHHLQRMYWERFREAVLSEGAKGGGELMGSERSLRLDVIWARHENSHGIPNDAPQFVTAFPSSLGEHMPELYSEWVKAACDQYRQEVDAPVVAFYESLASIERLETFDCFAVDLIEDEAINPDWETQLAELHAEPEGDSDA